MSRMVGVGSGGTGTGREDLPTRLLGWWLHLGRWWRGRW